MFYRKCSLASTSLEFNNVGLHSSWTTWSFALAADFTSEACRVRSRIDGPTQLQVKRHSRCRSGPRTRTEVLP